jgi:hypothetical protein
MAAMTRVAVTHSVSSPATQRPNAQPAAPTRARPSGYASEIMRATRLAGAPTPARYTALRRQAETVERRVRRAESAVEVSRQRAAREALDATRELNELLAAARREGAVGHRIWSAAHKPAEALQRQLAGEAGRVATRGAGGPRLPTAGPAARLDVAAAPHGEVRSYGWAELFPAGTVHAHRSTAVVAGNNCLLESSTHYHVQRASMSAGRLATDRAAREALRRAAEDPSERRIDDLMRELKRIDAPTPAHGPAQRSVPLRARHTTYISGAEAAQVGDGSRMTVNTRFVVEETHIPLVGLLAADRELTRAFVASLREPAPGAATSHFLAHVLAAAGGVDDRMILEHAQGVPRPDTRLLSIFGMARVDRAEAVMVGSNNQLRTHTTIHRPGLGRHTVLHDLAKLAEHARPAPSPATVPQRATGTERSMPSRARPAGTGGAPGPGGRRGAPGRG